MSYKLEKTFFSQPIRPGALFISVLSFMFLLLIFIYSPLSFTANGELVFKEGEYWRAFTSALMHADLTHLSHNAFFFTGLAFILNGYFGIWIFPVITLFMGGIINLLTLYFYPPEVTLVGVSGIVYFMAAFWLTSFILIERRYSIAKRLIYALGMALIFFFPETFRPETSYLAHGIGFTCGVPMAIAYFLMNLRKIRSKEVWIFKPDSPVDFDWKESEENGFKDLPRNE